MSGIDDIYESDNQGALASRETFKRLFAADPSSLLLLTDVDARRLKPRFARLAESQNPEELSEYLSTLIDEYRPALLKVQTQTFAYNVPAYTIKLREQLASLGNRFWQQATIPTSLAIVIAECLHRAEADMKPAEAPAQRTFAPIRTLAVAIPSAPSVQPLAETLSATDIAARKKRWQQTIKAALADKLADGNVEPSAYSGPKWQQCENLADISGYLSGHGFLPLAAFKETVEQRNRPVQLASHNYFVHPGTGILASIDKHVGSAPNVAFYSAMAEANGVPTGFAEFADTVKISFKLDDVRSRLVIGRIHNGFNAAPDPAGLIKQFEKAVSTNTLLSLSGFPAAPTGLDEQGHLVWHDKQGLKKRLGADHQQILQVAVISLPATLQTSATELLPRDKQAPKLAQFVARYGEEALPSHPFQQTTPVTAETTKPILSGKQRALIPPDGIANEKMLGIATQWNAGVATKAIADVLCTSERNIYQLAAKLREDAAFLPRRYRVKAELVGKGASQGRSANRSQFDLEAITNSAMREWAAKWNDGASPDDLADALGIKATSIYEVARKLRLDADFALRRFKAGQERVTKLQKRKARLPIDTGQIENQEVKAFADRWNDPEVSMNDLVAEMEGSQTGMIALASKLRANPGYVPRKFRVDKSIRDKLFHRAGRHIKVRTQIDLDAVQNPDMRDWARRWNEGEAADSLASDLGIKERSIYEVAKRILSQPDYIAASFRSLNAAPSDESIATTPSLQRRTRTPISTDDISDPKCRAFAADWNSGKHMRELTAEYGVGQVRIFQVASRLRSDPAYRWGARGSRKNAIKTQPRLSLSGPRRIGTAPSPAYQAAAPKTGSVVTSQEIAELQLRKQQATQDVRRIMSKALAMDLVFAEQNALADDFTDLATAEHALKELGFRVSRDKSNGHLERDYSHKSGLGLTLRVRNNEDHPEFTIAFGFYELGSIPSTYENLKARAGYITKVQLQDKEHSRRIVMYRSMVDARMLGQTLLEVQTCVRSGMFGLCPYQNEPTVIGPARVVPQPIRLSVSPSLATLDRLLEYNGLSVEKIRPHPYAAAAKAPEVAVAKPIANVIIAALSGDGRFNLVNQLRGENKSELAEISALINKNMEATLGECPTYNLNILRSADGGQIYDSAAITAKVDPNARNIVCLGVTEATAYAARLFIRERRQENDDTLVIGFHNGLGKADQAKLLMDGFDDVKPVDQDPAVLGANILALYRRPRSTQQSENIGPFRLVWSNNALKERTLQRIAIQSTTGERDVHLTGKELRIFESLSRNKGQMRSRDQLFNTLYADLPSSDAPEIKIIDVFMCKLRKKLDQALWNAGLANPAERIIDTNWGRGYTLNPNFGQNIQMLGLEVGSGSLPIRPQMQSEFQTEPLSMAL